VDESLVLVEDHVPGVVCLDVRLAVSAHCLTQPAVVDQQRETLDEFVPVAVIEAGVAPLTMIGYDVTTGVGQHRRADGECFEREQREALEG